MKNTVTGILSSCMCTPSDGLLYSNRKSYCGISTRHPCKMLPQRICLHVTEKWPFPSGGTESNFNLHIYTHLVPIVPYNKVFNLIHVQSDERENQIESYQQMTGKKKRYLIKKKIVKINLTVL